MLEPTIEYEKGDIYYGSTTQPLHKRFFGHKSFNNINNKKSSSNSKILFEKYGIANIKIILIKYFSCENKKELEAEEAKYIRENMCVNKLIPGRSKKEWYEENKEKNKQLSKEWREDNKEKLKEQKKDYYELNKEKINEKKKVIYQANKEKIKKQGQKYRENNKEKIKEKRREFYKEHTKQIEEQVQEYRKNNIEKVKENLKKYYETNIEIIKEYKKEYYEKNKSKIKEKRKETFICVCGSICLLTGKAEHLKSNKHLSFINSS